MSKLTHSNESTMAKIEFARLVAEGHLPKITLHDEEGLPLRATTIVGEPSILKFYSVENPDVWFVRFGGNELSFQGVPLNELSLDVAPLLSPPDWADEKAAELEEEFSGTDDRGNPVSIYNRTSVAAALREAAKRGK